MIRFTDLRSFKAARVLALGRLFLAGGEWPLLFSTALYLVPAFGFFQPLSGASAPAHSAGVLSSGLVIAHG
ncbi:MAG: hypothetical protein CMJ81_07295 [Planctomycetaceae bacterium]|nr:hypothetical protein [Planctomycetaceae bacterium]